MLGISSVPCIAHNTVKRVYVSHEIAINYLQSGISFWEMAKQRFMFLGYGKKPLTYISAFFLACACLPVEDMTVDRRFGFLSFAVWMHVPRALLAIKNYFVDIEIDLLRDQIKRLVRESEGGVELDLVTDQA